VGSESLEANDKLITITNLDFDCHTAKISPEAVELYSDIKDKKSFSTQKVLTIYNLNKEERDRAQNFEWSMLLEVFTPCTDTFNLKKLKNQIDQIKNQPPLSSEVHSVGNKNTISPLFSNANPDSNYFPTQAGTQKNLQKEKKANLILEAKNKFQKFEKANCPIGTFQSDKEWVQITDKGIHFSNLAPLSLLKYIL
jgi:hypothetical protein